MRKLGGRTLVTSGLTGTFFPSGSCPDLGVGNKLLAEYLPRGKYRAGTQGAKWKEAVAHSQHHAIADPGIVEPESDHPLTFCTCWSHPSPGLPGGNLSEEHRAFWATGSK